MNKYYKRLLLSRSYLFSIIKTSIVIIILFHVFYHLVGIPGILYKYFYPNDLTISDSDEYFIEYAPLIDTRHATEHSVLYHNIGDSITHAKNADILLLGNSHVQMGLRGQYIKELAHKLGLKVFYLSTGAQRSAFPLSIIKKYNLSPKIVIVDADIDYFQHVDTVSWITDAYAKQDRWGAYKEYFEVYIRWHILKHIHAVFPYISLKPIVEHDFIIFRSSITGNWFFLHEPKYLKKIDSSLTMIKATDEEIGFAMNFKQELDKRHILLVLTRIPYINHQTNVESIASHLNVPVIILNIDNLTSNDRGLHLDEKSSQRFVQSFWHEFIKIPQVGHVLFP